MKNVNYVINGVLAIAVIILFIMQFTGRRIIADTSQTVMTSSGENAATLPVAYINIDTLISNYYFSIDLGEQMTKKQEDATAYLNQEARKFQTAYESFQYRLQNNAFTTQERVDQESQRLQRQQQELQALNDRLTQNLLDESRRLNEQLRDTILYHVKEYNQIKQFQIIFSNTSNFDLVTPNPVFLADKSYNITEEFIDYLNKKWTSPK